MQRPQNLTNTTISVQQHTSQNNFQHWISEHSLFVLAPANHHLSDTLHTIQQEHIVFYQAAHLYNLCLCC